METKKNKLLELWNVVYETFLKAVHIEANKKNMLLIVLEDLIIEISRYDCSVIRTAYIRRKFKEHTDSFFFLLADITEEELFRLTFQILISVLEQFIKEREIETEFEAAANLLEVKKIIEYQQDKWLI